MKTLIILAHPDFDNSLANKTIMETLEKKGANFSLRNLHQLYPDFKIDTEAEQAALLDHDTIIFQYPFYWYNMPAILKHWFDRVFTYQFAYGSEGDKLKGKKFQLSFTVGGPTESYRALGYNHFRIGDFLKNLEQTAYLSQMEYQEPIYTHSMVYIEGVYNKKEEVEARGQAHAERLLSVMA